METDVLGSNGQNKQKELLTVGNKKLIFSHIGSAVIGAAIGASISRIIPIKQPDVPTDDEKDTTPTNDNSSQEPIEEPKKEEPKEEEPKEEEPKEEEPKEEEPKEEEPKEEEPKEEEPKEDSENPSQDEIDKIAEDLVKDSKIDDRDIIDEGSLLHFTDYVKINLPNGLEADGFVFDIEGQNFVLADLDGDGVYDNLLAHVNGMLTDVDIPIFAPDGSIVTTLNEIIARNHLTESDIEQIVNENGDIDLVMTDTERRQIENDDVEGDIARVEEPNKVDDVNSEAEGEELDIEEPNKPEVKDDDVAQLSPEEEDVLLQDLLGKHINKSNVADSYSEVDEIIQVDDEDEVFKKELEKHPIDNPSYPDSPNDSNITDLLESNIPDEISELPIDD